MAKKTFKSENDGPMMVSVQGGWVEFAEKGDTVETEDPAVIEALEANPDVSAGGGKKKKGD